MKRIVLPQAGIETLYGARDANLKHVESLFKVAIRTQGDELIVTGDSGDEQRVVKLFEQLSGLIEDGYALVNGDVKTAAQLFAQNPSVDLRDYFNRGGPAQGGQAARSRSGASIRRASTSGATSTPSTSSTSCSASARRAPARPIWRWRRRCNICWRRR